MKRRIAIAAAGGAVAASAAVITRLAYEVGKWEDQSRAAGRIGP